MEMKLFPLLLFLCSFASILGQAKEGERVFTHPLTNMAGPSEDVDTSYFFPGHSDLKFPIGETVTALCHFSNDGESPLNITAIMGSLNFVYDFRHYIQNYTYKPFGIVVKGGEEVTLEYQFQLHPELEPIEYTLAHTVFYESEREAFTSTFVNQVRNHFHKMKSLGVLTLCHSKCRLWNWLHQIPSWTLQQLVNWSSVCCAPLQLRFFLSCCASPKNIQISSSLLRPHVQSARKHPPG